MRTFVIEVENSLHSYLACKDIYIEKFEEVYCYEINSTCIMYCLSAYIMLECIQVIIWVNFQVC